MNKEEKVLFLDGFRMKISLLNSLNDKKKTLISGMENCKAIEYSDMPKSSGVGSDISDKLAKKQELEERIERLAEKISDMRKAIIKEIDNNIFDMNINEATFSYYISGLSKTEISFNLKYCEKTISRYIATGLDLIFNN